MIKKENIPPDPGQSFRFFSWKDSLEKLYLYQGEGAVVEKQGIGNEWHYHPELELTLFTEGKGIRYIGDDVRSFTAPELVFLGSNLPHHWTVDHSSGHCIQFSFAPTSPLAGLHEIASMTVLLEKAKRGLLFSAKCAQDVRALMEESQACAPVERLAIFLKILHRINTARTKTISESVPQGLSGRKSEVIKRAVRYIVQNATKEELELQDVLEHVKMSRATFSRQFQQMLGQSYTQFVQAIRLETARNMLTSTEKSVTEIAFAAGFSNLSHFNSLFKKRWAMTPRDLRQMLQQGKKPNQKPRRSL